MSQKKAQLSLHYGIHLNSPQKSNLIIQTPNLTNLTCIITTQFTIKLNSSNPKKQTKMYQPHRPRTVPVPAPSTV